MNDTKNMVCILCPMGCRLTAKCADGEVTVTGNTCARGRGYATEELTDPRRMVTSSVGVGGGHMALLSVKTAQPVPKGAIHEVLEALQQVHAKAPVAVGTVVLPNAAGTGVDVVATRNIRAGR